MEKAVFDPDEMYTFVKGFASGAVLPNTLAANAYARKMHDGQKRRSGDPYIIHPLTMCCHAIACGVRDDETLATILLHDVLEDCPGVQLDNLPVNEKVKHAVQLMTFTVLPGETKETATARYFHLLPSCREAALTKLFDRAHNVSTLVGTTISMEKLRAYIEETRIYVLPLLCKVKDLYPECGEQLVDLEYHIVSVINAIDLTIRMCGQ